jgi:hypothetical protein
MAYPSKVDDRLSLTLSISIFRVDIGLAVLQAGHLGASGKVSIRQLEPGINLSVHPSMSNAS